MSPTVVSTCRGREGGNVECGECRLEQKSAIVSLTIRVWQARCNSGKDTRSSLSGSHLTSASPECISESRSHLANKIMLGYVDSLAVRVIHPKEDLCSGSGNVGWGWGGMDGGQQRFSIRSRSRYRTTGHSTAQDSTAQCRQCRQRAHGLLLLKPEIDLNHRGVYGVCGIHNGLGAANLDPVRPGAR